VRGSGAFGRAQNSSGQTIIEGRGPVMARSGPMAGTADNVEVIFLVEEAPEGGYVAHALDRPRVIRLHLVRDEVLPV